MLFQFARAIIVSALRTMRNRLALTPSITNDRLDVKGLDTKTIAPGACARVHLDRYRLGIAASGGSLRMERYILIVFNSKRHNFVFFLKEEEEEEEEDKNILKVTSRVFTRY